jgi:glyoxalase family protein
MSSNFRVLGLHHVTATVDDAQADLGFCLDGLGLRLVKKTVNFDNHHVYHFYYGNERGTPGTIWTTFPYKGRGVRVGVKGAGQITSTAFSVPSKSLGDWKKRLVSHGIAVESAGQRFGEDAIACTDPSGLNFEIVGTDRDDRPAWTKPGEDEAVAIRGLHGVTLSIRSPRPTIEFLTGFLGLRISGDDNGRTRVTTADGEPGKSIDILHTPDAPQAINGLGTVHHVALAVADADEQLRIREALVKRGHQVTPVMDRQYFTSIYFREPGGVLLEIATAGPGFLIDEDLSALGRGLKLPPWEEPNRTEIEAGLARVQYS